jgi:hypothetical protein
MRGDDKQLQSGMFSYVSLEDRVPQDHPLRAIRRLVDQVLTGMSKEFDRLYSDVGRPSIPPERLLHALLLMEQLDYNLLFRWFVGLEIDDRVWDAPPMPGRIFTARSGAATPTIRRIPRLGCTRSPLGKKPD